jgi:cytochrome b561
MNVVVQPTVPMDEIDRPRALYQYAAREGKVRSMTDQDAYAPAARHMHWLTVILIAGLVPLGLYMTYRGGTLDIWDGTTNALYSAHKLTGFVVLWLVVARLIFRLMRGAPPDEPTLEPWQKKLSHIVHWALYGLLFVVPLAGWLGVSLYPALGIFGLFDLPALTKPDQDMAERVLQAHKFMAFALVGLICAHIGAALFHHFIRKDGVLRRMLPRQG